MVVTVKSEMRQWDGAPKNSEHDTDVVKLRNCFPN
jgi:hypothetical protein